MVNESLEKLIRQQEVNGLCFINGNRLQLLELINQNKLKDKYRKVGSTHQNRIIPGMHFEAHMHGYKELSPIRITVP